MKHLNIKIYGFVQGVSFRYFVEQKANELGIKGFVRNEPDGTVYIEAESTEGALRKFVELCKKGPMFAKVEETEISEGNSKSFASFEVMA